MRFVSLFLAVYMCLLSLAPQWQGLEFFKLDALFEHYTQYKQESSNGGFWTFVKEHYVLQVNEKHQEHRELPFKSTQSNSLVTLFMPVSSSELFIEPFSIHFPKQAIYSAPNALHINDYFEYWHPPQLV